MEADRAPKAGAFSRMLHTDLGSRRLTISLVHQSGEMLLALTSGFLQPRVVTEQTGVAGWLIVQDCGE